MAITDAVRILPYTVIFFLSGFVVNLVQAICFILIRPFSNNTYRRINRMVVELLWLELVWIVDWWANVKIKVFADPETLQLMGMGKENALVICNHKGDIDWLVGLVLAQRAGCLGSALAVTDMSIRLLPVIGWSMWFSEYLFLEKRWAKDELTFKLGLQSLKDYPIPFWLALFVEGTRFTEAKLVAAREYATSFGLPLPRNVLIPRTKGFVSTISHMRSYVPAVYDMTLAIPKSSPWPTMVRLFNGKPSVVHVHIKRHSMKDLPETADDVAQWCKDVFIAKDELLDKHNADGTFGDQQLQDIGRPVKSLVVMASWAGILIVGLVKLLVWSWKGVAVLAVGLGLMTRGMNTLILVSQSEPSLKP